MSKKTILFIHHFSELGGAEQFLVSIWKNMDGNFTSVLLNQGEGDLSRAAETAGVRHVAFALPGWRKLKHWLSRRQAISKVVRLCRELKADCICSGCYRITPYAVAAAGELKIPCLTILQDFTDLKKLQKFRVFDCDRLVTVSKGLAESIKAHYKGKIDVIYNGIDTGDLPEAESEETGFKDEFSIPPDALVVGMIAHIVPWKGHKVFLDAMKRLSEEQGSIYFVVVGESLYKHELDQRRLEEYAQELGIRERVIFTGGRKDIFHLLRSFDVLVHPAEREPFGRVIIEAMAVGVPVVATACGGPQEIIDHDKTGILVSVNDSQGIARETQRLLDDKDLRRRMGQKGREKILREFNDRTVLKKFNHVLRELTGVK